MKTRTRIGAMILVLALLCVVPVGAGETKTIVNARLLKTLQNASSEDMFSVAIWLPQADWGTGTDLHPHSLVGENCIYVATDTDAIRAFLARARLWDEEKQVSDKQWFIETYRLPSWEYGIGAYGGTTPFILATLTAVQLWELIDADPDVYIGYPVAQIERLPMSHTGDADENGTVNSADARLVLQYAIGKVTNPRFIHLYEADINGDNTVDSADARQILQKTVGKS